MAAVIGVTQKQIENEYYMLDLVDMAKKTRKYRAFYKLDLMAIVNSSRMEERDYREIVNNFMSEAQVGVDNKFDRSKFEELRALT